MPILYALSDLHLSYAANREALSLLRPHPNDALILAGDLGETLSHLRLAFDAAIATFDRVYWVPGNHELYTMPSTAANSVSSQEAELRGESKYWACVTLAREYGVRTPEDEWEVWDSAGDVSSSASVADGEPKETKALICPMFTLYDYSFRPEHVDREGALAWAKEENIEATDEHLLHNDPHPSRDAWCEALCERFEKKLVAARKTHPTLPFVLVNHWPLKERLVHLFLVPRFSIWCGTKATEDWAERFGANVVVTG
jgi:3',5'-cyclic AMP phosphodiesterase CpdA